MKNCFLYLLILIGTNNLHAQKQLIDTSVYGKWPSVRFPSLTNDGMYVKYSIWDPVNAQSINYIQSINGKWKKELPESLNPNIADNKLIYRKGDDSLCLQKLGASQVEYIPDVASFTFSREGTNSWLIYRLRSVNDLVLRKIKTGKEKRYSGIDNYYFKGQKNIILVGKNIKDGKVILYWVDLENDNKEEIWRGEGDGPEIFLFDETEKQLIFETGGKKSRCLWYYKSGTDKAILLLDNQSLGINSNLVIDKISRFSNDGSRLFLYLKSKPLCALQPDAIRLNVWSYQDSILQPAQIENLSEDRSEISLFVLRLATRELICLKHGNEEAMLGEPTKSQYPENYITLASVSGITQGEAHWNKKVVPNHFLVSTQDGSRKILPSYNNLGLSYSEKYVLFFDKKMSEYGVYEISSGKYNIISAGIPQPLVNKLNSREIEGDNFGVAGWMKNDEALLLYDEFDIWQVDPQGKKKPVNLTRRYGRRMNIKLRSLIPEYKRPIFVSGNRMLLTGFNPDTKENSFLSIIIGKAKDPELLSKGLYTCYAPQKMSGLSIGEEPIKALSADRYLVRRESTIEYPNYFITGDFRNFTPLTNLSPQRDFNWMTAELHAWKSLDGQSLQGVLYKPENFDPNKKYPIIIYYYELMSDDMTAFHYAEPSDGRLNVTWYVSNGYLVFTPDIHLTIGNPFQGTYDAVISAANHLSKLSYINAQKMGIQGISFGGVQTNYLITHTNLFAAACSSSSTSDFISHYGAIAHFGNSSQGFLEVGQMRAGASLWERPEWYIQNSPVLRAPFVTTPVLMMHTSVDDACPFPQAVELFTDLRRLGKKVWLLEYQDGNHGLWGKPAKDFSFRMSQFFDHYLKDKAAPVWMTRGIPFARKGIDTGLEYDTEIQTPGDGLLTPEAQRKLDSLMLRKPLTITLQ